MNASQSELNGALKLIAWLGLGAGAVGVGIPVAAHVIKGTFNTVTGNPGQFAMQGVGAYQMYKQRQGIENLRDDTKYIPELSNAARDSNQSLDSIRNEIAAIAVQNRAGLPPQNITVPRDFGIPVHGRVSNAAADAYRTQMMTGVGRRGGNGKPFIWGRE